jgi:TATA-binding protein-associated factor Taf7
MQKFVKTDMNECGSGHGLTADFCHQRSTFVVQNNREYTLITCNANTQSGNTVLGL